jgi:hypothetical protein
MSSRGMPQSAQDIIVHVDADQRLLSKIKADIDWSKTGFVSTVVAATEILSLDGHAPLEGRDPRKIAVEYAIAQNSHQGSGELQAMKLAVLTICKKWGVRFYCQSLLNERFLTEVRDGLSRSKELDVRPKLILQILQSEEANKMGLVNQLKRSFKFLGEKGVDISRLTLESLGAAGVNAHRPEDIILDGTPDQFDWLRAHCA